MSSVFDSVPTPVIGTIFGLISMWGGLWLRSKFDLSERRIAARKAEDDKCDRLEVSFYRIVDIARQLKQEQIAMNTIATSGKENAVEFALFRLQECATRKEQIDSIIDYVEGARLNSDPTTPKDTVVGS